MLKLVGLALRAGKLEAGEDAAADACQYRKARLLLIASDAAERSVSRALYTADESGCVPLMAPWSKEELGAALGRKSCAVAAVTDLGLARAVVEKLAETDEERYGEAADRLRRKAERLAERREKTAKAKQQGNQKRPVKYKKK